MCVNSFCPSRITVCPIQIGSVERFCVFYVPHNHSPTLYSGNPSCLPPFLQLVLHYYSALNYFNICKINSVNQLHQFILDENRKQFLRNCVKKLNDVALCDFGLEIGTVVENDEMLNGKESIGIISNV